MGVDPDEFSDRDPIAFDAVQAAKDAPADDPFNPRCRSDIPITESGSRSSIADPDEANGVNRAGAPDEFPEGAVDAEPDAEADANHPAGASARDIDRHTFATTFFPDKRAMAKFSENPTLPQLAEAIRRTTAASKFELPWLKLASFGDKRSKNNCLRTNDNLIEISGVEGDHDSGELPFDAAVAIMRKARIRCLFYTSASYVPVVKERWRILVPLSKNHRPSFRREMVAELNGLLGGALAGESFTLSLSYLFGSVNNNRDHRVEVIDGNFLDQCLGLLEGAIFKDGRKGLEGLTGVRRHQPRANPNPPGPVARSKVEAALAAFSSNCKYGPWLKVAAALYHQFGEDGFDLFDDWSIKADGLTASDGTPMYTSEKTEARWEGAQHDRHHDWHGLSLCRQGRSDVARPVRGRGTAAGLGGAVRRHPRPGR